MMIKYWYLLILLFLGSRLATSLNANTTSQPQATKEGHTVAGLVGHFTFEKGAQDLLGNFGPTELNGVKVNKGALQVDRATWAQAPYIAGPVLYEKTFVSFVRLKGLDPMGGSLINFMRNDASYYNGLALGETPWKFSAINTYWNAVSESKNRTKNLRPGFKEENTHELLKMTIVYKNIGGKCQTTIYRNDQQIAQYLQGKLETLAPNNSKVLFGMRQFHDKTRLYVPYFQVWLKADIEEVQIYDRVLSPAEIKVLDYVK